MSRKAIVALLLIALAIVAALIVWKWVFKKSEVNVSSKKAEIEIEAAVLTREFEENEEGQLYRVMPTGLEKVVFPVIP